MTASTTRDSAAVLIRGADAEGLSFPDGSSMQLLGERVGGPSTFSVHRTQLRFGAIGASPHHHRATTELIYVIAGALELVVGDQLVEARMGDLAFIPPGTTHAFAATPDGDADFLDLVTPAIARFDLFREIARIAGGAPPSADLADQSRFDTYADESPHWAQRQERTRP